MRPALFLAIQLVEVRYHKSHRGGAGAQQRARLPQAFTLPIVGERGVLHQCSMDGWDGFVPRSFAEEPLVRDGSVVLRHTWRITLGHSQLTLHSHAHGRDNAPTLLAVPHGQWARMRTNHREQNYDDFWYADLIVNFGGFASQPEPDVFLGAPDLALDLRHDLLRRGRRPRRP